CRDASGAPLTAEQVGLVGVAETMLDAGKADGVELGEDDFPGQVVKPATAGFLLQPAPVAPHPQRLLEVTDGMGGGEYPRDGRQGHWAPGRLGNVDGKDEASAFPKDAMDFGQEVIVRGAGPAVVLRREELGILDGQAGNDAAKLAIGPARQAVTEIIRQEAD